MRFVTKTNSQQVWRFSGYWFMVIAILLSIFSNSLPVPVATAASPALSTTSFLSNAQLAEPAPASTEKEKNGKPDPIPTETTPVETEAPPSRFYSGPGTPITFTSSGGITITDNNIANPYPSAISVSGVSGNVLAATVKLTNLSHSYPEDIDILLIGPAGQKTILMSDAGTGSDLVNVSLTFDDTASNSLSTAAISSGTYKPTDLGTSSGCANDNYSSPAPSSPYSVTLSSFNLVNPSGNWQLYVRDDCNQDSGSLGSWSITLYVYPQPVITTYAGSGQSTGVTTNFATPLQVQVRDSNGNFLVGSVVTFTAPVGGASGTFAGGSTVFTATTDSNGIATATAFTANNTSGSYNVTVSGGAGTLSANIGLTNLAGSPASIAATSGNNQTALVNNSFGQLLVATLYDTYNNPVPGKVITFTAPTGGASGKFSNNTQVFTATTNASGRITSTTFTANATAGTYNVVATAEGVASSTSFMLTNNPLGSIAVTSGNNQNVLINSSFGQPLVVTVYDTNNNPAGSQVVTFTAPTSGASGKFSNNTQVFTATTDVSGRITVTFTANSISGTYNVTAVVNGVASNASFTLTNTPLGSIMTTSGSGQNTTIATNFLQPLVATVYDSNNSPASGQSVTFTAPGSGASLKFSNNSQTIAATTDASGRVTVTNFTANTITGTYNVTATVAGIAGAAVFTLTNIPVPNLITTIPVLDSPWGIAVNPATNRVYLDNWGASKLSVIDTIANSVITNVALTSAYGSRVAINPNTNRIYVTRYAGPQTSISVLDGNTNSIIATTTVGSQPDGVAINSLTNRIYVANFGTTTVSVVNGNTNTVLATIGVGSNPAGVGVNPNTNRIYVANYYSNNMSVINGNNNSVIATFGVGTQPYDVAVNPNTNRIYVTNNTSNTVSVIDGNTNSVIATISGFSAPWGIALNNITNRIYVVNRNNNTISVVDGNTNTIVNNFLAGAYPAFVAVNTCTSRLYVTNYDNDTVSVLEDDVKSYCTTLNLNSGPNPAQYGQSTTFTATVNSPVTATGTISFTEGATFLGSGTLNGNVATFTTNSLLAGTHVISATYSGDSNNSSSSSTTISQLVRGSISLENGNNQSTRVVGIFWEPLIVRVPNLAPGELVTFTVPSSGPSGSFEAGGAMYVSGADANGMVTASTLLSGMIAGSFNITVTAAGASAYFSLTNTPGDPDKLATTSNTTQATQVNTAFASPFVVKVSDAYNNTISNQEVVFTAPDSGASGTFANGTAIYTGTTDANGLITTTLFTANTLGGSYQVTGTTYGLTAYFTLTNQIGPPVSLTVTSGNNQAAPVNTAFYAALGVRVSDAYNNPISGQAVTFTLPSLGASGTTTEQNSYTTTTDSSGQVTLTNFTANNFVGSYVVTATSSPASQILNLTNQPNGYTANQVYGQLGSFNSSNLNKGGLSANSLATPAGMSLAGASGLYVADFSNSRVLYYPPNSTTAFMVYGQTNMSSASSGTGTGGLRNPTSPVLASDGSGSLYIADAGNNRVLYYPPFSNSANRVYGQNGDFNANTANNGGISENSLKSPEFIAPDSSGGIYVSDVQNNRVLYFPNGSTTATRVYGQPNFNSDIANNGGISANSLWAPEGLAVDSAGGLYVADSRNNRVLYFPAGSTTATRVYGQNGNFTTNNVGAGRDGFQTTMGLALDSNNGLYVADYLNNRVLYFAHDGDTKADGVYGQLGSFITNGLNTGGISANSLRRPIGLTIDNNNNKLYIADFSNNRILVYPTQAVGSFQFENASYQQTEGNSLVINVTRTGGNSMGAVVVVSATNLSTTNADYNFTPNTLTWADGDSSPKTVTVTVNSDSQEEGSESFRLNLLGYNGGINLGSSANPTFTINDIVPTTLSLTSSPNPSTIGQNVTFTATLNSVIATGTITFSEGETTLGTGSLSSGVATFTTGSLPIGSHVITATYSGNSTYIGSSSNPATHIVTAACNPMLVASTADDGSCGTLRHAINTATAGQTITITLAAGSTINLTSGLTLTSGVSLITAASCNGSGPAITLQGGSGVGLTLNGNNSIYGIWLKNFSGKQLVVSSSGNTLYCVKATRN